MDYATFEVIMKTYMFFLSKRIFGVMGRGGNEPGRARLCLNRPRPEIL